MHYHDLVGLERVLRQYNLPLTSATLGGEMQVKWAGSSEQSLSPSSHLPLGSPTLSGIEVCPPPFPQPCCLSTYPADTDQQLTPMCICS